MMTSYEERGKEVEFEEGKGIGKNDRGRGEGQGEREREDSCYKLFSYILRIYGQTLTYS